MIILGLLLTLVVIGLLCWTLFQLVVFALPFFAGLSAGLALVHGGAGRSVAIVAGVLVGAATLIAGQLIFTLVPSAFIRLIVAAVFVVPALLAGYHAAHGVSGLGDNIRDLAGNERGRGGHRGRSHGVKPPCLCPWWSLEPPHSSLTGGWTISAPSQLRWGAGVLGCWGAGQQAFRFRHPRPELGR